MKTPRAGLRSIKLANDYQTQGLPVLPAEQLQEEAIAETRKYLATMMACKAKGHLRKEKGADPENGISALSCRCCGTGERLCW